MAHNEGTFRISELVRMLPHQLQVRFNSLSGYVLVTIDEELESLGKGQRRPPPETIQMIQLAALLFTLDEFLRAGTAAAKSASLTFVDLGTTGFTVGSTPFTPTNHATMRGNLLAERLRTALRGTELLRVINRARSMRELIQILLMEFKDDETVGGPA